MESKNVIFKDCYLINDSLCLALLEGRGFKNIEGMTKTRSDAYLVFMCVLNTKDNSLMFKSI